MSAIRWLIKLFYLPVFLLAGNGIAIYLVGSGYADAWLRVGNDSLNKQPQD